MQAEPKPISSLKPYPGNAKKHTPEQIKSLAESIREFGIQTAALITADNEIIVGHGRIQAAASLGYTDYPCVVNTTLTDEQIKAYRLIDNQTTLETPFDLDILRDELQSIIGIDLAPFNFPDFIGSADTSGDVVDAAIAAETIRREQEYKPTADDKADKIKTQTSAIIERLADEKPELLAKAICVIVPSGRGDFRHCVVITDPRLGDIVSELKRYADDGIESPCAALMEGLVSYAADA